MRQAPGAFAVLIGFAGSASAAAAMGVAETGGMMLIGAGLILGALFGRSRTRRG